MASAIETYARDLFRRFDRTIVSGEVFAKLLTRNDDSGRHGVLVPNEAYSFFPALAVPDPQINATVEFQCLDVKSAQSRTLAWKYYQRYPERRITRLNTAICEAGPQARLVIFLRGKDRDGLATYLFDYSIEGKGAGFPQLISLLFAEGIPRTPGAFVRVPVDARKFGVDADLGDLLARFDDVSARGWIRTLRAGDTGVGFTFETLIGIAENNDKRADFQGIEVKCKLAKGPGAAQGKTNLFQQGPRWNDGRRAIDRLKAIGQRREDGTFACYSQVTVECNNLDLLLKPDEIGTRVDLLKSQSAIGHWPYALLQKRLQEKHSRAAFVKAMARRSGSDLEYRYGELVYCERPSIEKFIELVGSRSIVFEFLMHERANGSVRNHGYPWRLSNQTVLGQLFDTQIRLRG